MYLEFFHFARSPFSNTAETVFYYSSAAHREALATLYYGISERKGLCILSGPVGCGKTLILHKLIADHKHMQCALLTNPWLDREGLFRFFADEFGLALDPSHEPLAQLQKQMREATGKVPDCRYVFLVDEAHLLSEDTLGAIRLLLNLEDERGKLTQIILSGQEELIETLRQHHMRPLLQRVSLVEHLQPFDIEDTIGYIQHRLRSAGGDPYLFPRLCIEIIHEQSRGVPRVINQICDHALMFAYGRQSRTAERQDIEAALAKLPLGMVFLAPEPNPTSNTQREEKASPPPPPISTSADAKGEPESKTAGTPPLNRAFSEQTIKQPAPDQHEEVAAIRATVPNQGQNQANTGSIEQSLESTPNSIRFSSNPDKPEKVRSTLVTSIIIATGMIVALFLGAAIAYWVISERINVQGSNNTQTTIKTEIAPLVQPKPPQLPEAIPELLPSSLPLPVTIRTVEHKVADATLLLTLISEHFGSDNASVRDLVISLNPTLNFDQIAENTVVRFPRLQRKDLIVPDSQGRFYIYYATLTDQALVAQVRDTFQSMSVESLSTPTMISGRPASRIHLGPFTQTSHANRVLEMVRFSYLPMLEKQTSALRPE